MQKNNTFSDSGNRQESAGTQRMAGQKGQNQQQLVVSVSHSNLLAVVLLDGGHELFKKLVVLL
jgi:hypothetical protein